MSYLMCGICGQGFFMTAHSKICVHCDRPCTRENCIICKGIQAATGQLDKQLPPKSSGRPYRWDDGGPDEPA